MEAIRLRDRYETPEGFIIAATEEAILKSFLVDARCCYLFARLSMPVAGEVLVDLEKSLKEKDLAFRLPNDYQGIM